MVVTAPPPLENADPEQVEGGVIDDARERQRRHRRFGALLIVAALASLIAGFVTGGGGSGASQLGHGHSPGATPATHASARPPAIGVPWPDSVSDFGLMAPGVGWAGVPLYLTRNGGHSWERVPVKTVGAATNMSWSSSAGPGQVAFSQADGGQNALTIPEGASAAQWISEHVRGEVMLTSNAGRSWSTHAFAAGKSPGALSFVNRRLGFALGYTAAAHHDPRASLYETRDGARAWTKIAPVPFTGMLSFANARDGLGGGWGWAAGLVDSAAIFRTTDGGRSWTRTSLCGMHGPTCETPSLFPSGRGVVLVTSGGRFTSRVTRVAVYTTRDNGASWTPHVLPGIPRLPIDASYIPFSAPNASDLFAWVTPYLYASHDGGRTWSRYAQPELIPRGQQPIFGNIAFANRSYGWYATPGLFAYTTDGGKHWTKFKQVR